MVSRLFQPSVVATTASLVQDSDVPSANFSR